MKTMKILVAAWGLFLMTSMNGAFAQEETERQDSIYGFNVSLIDDVINISFYSTYDMNKSTGITITSYDQISNEQLDRSVLFRDEMTPNPISFMERFFGIKFSCEKIAENIYKVETQEEYPVYIIIRDTTKPLKIELYIEGEGFVPPSDNLRAEAIGRSNVLTFLFDPMSTSLKDIIKNENRTFKYYLLSGKESKTIPLGIPFIQKTYNNGILMSTGTYFVGKE